MTKKKFLPTWAKYDLFSFELQSSISYIIAYTRDSLYTIALTSLRNVYGSLHIHLLLTLQNLGDLEDDYHPDEEDEEDENDRQISAAAVKELHFGGGFVRKTGGDEDENRPKYDLVFNTILPAPSRP